MEPSEQTSEEIKSQTSVTPLIDQSQCLLDLDIQPVALPSTDSQSKPALEDLSLSDSQVLLLIPCKVNQHNRGHRLSIILLTSNSVDLVIYAEQVPVGIN